MADQAKKATSGAQEQAQNASKGTPASGVQEKVNTATDSALGTVQNVGNKVAAKGQSIVDSIFPPDKRAAFLAKLQSFMLANQWTGLTHRIWQAWTLFLLGIM